MRLIEIGLIGSLAALAAISARAQALESEGTLAVERDANSQSDAHTSDTAAQADGAGEAMDIQRAPCDPNADADCDGLMDSLERATGTRALQADTDGDGVPDGEEDLSRDGIVDEGETDPRVPGLFPGRYPHIPEPMLFDLVRALDSKAGEVEVNAITVLRNHRRGHSELLWAPEVEWAFRDGMAVELELPMDGRELEAVKAAFQAALPLKRRGLSHGVQLIGEYLLDGHLGLSTALYILGARMGRWSVLTMFGGSALAGKDRADIEKTLTAESRYTLLVNPSLYRDLRENLTVGVESNLALGLDGYQRVRLVPQLHVQLSRRVRLQMGVGPEWENGHRGLIAASRLVLE